MNTIVTKAKIQKNQNVDISTLNTVQDTKQMDILHSDNQKALEQEDDNLK